MKALFELEFESIHEAKAAAKALDEKAWKFGGVKVRVQGKTLFAQVEASGFSKLRASCSSFLRCAKIVFDAAKIARE